MVGLSKKYEADLSFATLQTIESLKEAFRLQRLAETGIDDFDLFIPNLES